MQPNQQQSDGQPGKTGTFFILKQTKMAEVITLVIFLCLVIFVMGLISGLNEETIDPFAIIFAAIFTLVIVLVAIHNPLGVESSEPIQPILEIECKGEPQTGIVCDTTYIYKH